MEEYLIISNTNLMLRVAAQQIAYVCSEGSYCVLRLVDGDEYTFSFNLAVFEKKIVEQLAYLSYRSDGYIQQTHMLKTIAVLPKGGQMPKFDGNKDISEFLKWVMLNIKYPEGLETEPARVEIRFTVKTDGTLGNFKVLKAPKEKAYEQTVIELLKKSPRWTPAKLSDGTVVNMEFTLPVAFTPEAKTDETKKQIDKNK